MTGRIIRFSETEMNELSKELTDYMNKTMVTDKGNKAGLRDVPRGTEFTGYTTKGLQIDNPEDIESMTKDIENYAGSETPLFFQMRDIAGQAFYQLGNNIFQRDLSVQNMPNYEVKPDATESTSRYTQNEKHEKFLNVTVVAYQAFNFNTLDAKALTSDGESMDLEFEKYDSFNTFLFEDEKYKGTPYYGEHHADLKKARQEFAQEKFEHELRPLAITNMRYQITENNGEVQYNLIDMNLQINTPEIQYKNEESPDIDVSETDDPYYLVKKDDQYIQNDMPGVYVPKIFLMTSAINMLQKAINRDITVTTDVVEKFESKFVEMVKDDILSDDEEKTLKKAIAYAGHIAKFAPGDQISRDSQIESEKIARALKKHIKKLVDQGDKTVMNIDPKEDTEKLVGQDEKTVIDISTKEDIDKLVSPVKEPEKRFNPVPLIILAVVALILLPVTLLVAIPLLVASIFPKVRKWIKNTYMSQWHNKIQDKLDEKFPASKMISINKNNQKSIPGSSHEFVLGKMESEALTTSEDVAIGSVASEDFHEEMGSIASEDFSEEMGGEASVEETEEQAQEVAHKDSKSISDDQWFLSSKEDDAEEDEEILKK